MDLMNEHIEAADEAIADLIDDLCRDYKRLFSRDHEEQEVIIARIAKLRESMSPTITQIIHH